MNRTPRSASRRASRQLAANVPRLARLGAVQLEDVRRLARRRSVSSGTRRLHAVGHLVLRDARGDLRIADCLRACSWLSAPRSSSICAARRRVDARRDSTGTAPDRRPSGTSRPDTSTAESRCPTAGRTAADRLGLPDALRDHRDERRQVAGSRCPGRTTATSRCSGRPASCAPVWKNVIAGSWLIASVCIDLMKHSSSATLRRVRQQLAEPGAALAVLGELEHRRRRPESSSAARSCRSAAGPCGPSRAARCRAGPSSFGL